MQIAWRPRDFFRKGKQIRKGKQKLIDRLIRGVNAELTSSIPGHRIKVKEKEVKLIIDSRIAKTIHDLCEMHKDELQKELGKRCKRAGWKIESFFAGKSSILILKG
jgi:hypothetical protein